MKDNENKGLKHYAIWQPYTILNSLHYIFQDIIYSIFWKEIEISEFR